MTTINVPNIDTGYRVVAGSIDAGNGPSGYRIEGEYILHGSADTGCFLAGETIYRKPRLDTGFRILGGIVWGPDRLLPFFPAQQPERALAKTRKIEPLPAHAAVG